MDCNVDNGSNISKALKNNTKTAYGYYWKYLKEIVVDEEMCKKLSDNWEFFK